DRPPGGQAGPGRDAEGDRARQPSDPRTCGPARFPLQDLPAYDRRGGHRDGDPLLARHRREGRVAGPPDPGPRAGGRFTVALPPIECVPNFSEGRREDVLASLTASIRGVRGVGLLDVSPDPDHNRSVFTLAGPAEAVLEAAYRSAGVALQRIDLRTHHGVHP